MFFRKEREFYANYYQYKNDIDRIVECLELRYQAELPSDVAYVDDKYTKLTQSIKRRFLSNCRVRDLFRKVNW